MSCDRMHMLIDRHADGELGTADADRVERHLVECDACASRHRELLDLRARIHDEVPYYRAPPDLRDRMHALARHTVGNAPPTTSSIVARWRWLLSGALAGAVAAMLGWTVTTAVVEHRATEDVAVASVAAHVRATLDQRLVEVASFDQHRVKPWLSARLDYSPPVRDFAEQGFPLIGARIETLDGHRTATLVYGYRLHTVDVFVRPLPAPAAASLRSVRGFNVAHAVGGEMDWLAVSDLNADELKAFVQKLATAASSQ